jgi:predicted nucleic acid-binding protein
VAELFVLDANIFIEAARRYYAFDLVASFWDTLEGCASAGTVRSIDRVEQELLKMKDDLTVWASAKFNQWFESTAQPDVFQAYSRIVNWVQNHPYFKPSAKTEFASVADGWLVAFAMARGYTVATHEEFNKETIKRVKIPNVCREFGVPYTNTFDMLRTLGVKL